jgi:hypothetical protein
MLDEEEKNAALSNKEKCMWVHKCFRSRKSEGSYGRNSDGGIFAHSELGKYLETHPGIPEEKQFPGTLRLAPHVIMGDEAFPLKICLLKPYPESQSKGDNVKSIFNYMLSRSRRVVEKAFGILRTLQSLPENADNIIFSTCILHSYLRDQGVGLSDMVSSTNDQINLTKIPKQAGSGQ